MSTLKYFILIVIAFVLVVIFLAGPNPFSFGEAYFRPRSNSSPEITVGQPDIVSPQNSDPTEINIDR